LLSATVAVALAACQPATPADSAQAVPQETTVSVARQPEILVTPRVSVLTEGLNHPWAVALLPDGQFLVSERLGALRRISADGRHSVFLSGVPEVFGGLLDVVLAPDFRTSQRIYFSYVDIAAGIAVAYATLGDTGLSDVHVIYRQESQIDTLNHFSSRIAFDQESHIFISQGGRTLKMAAQELDRLQGKIVRLNLDGSIPADNPFVGQENARPEIWSYGHRNSQGLAVDPRTHRLWENEHGPHGGDEINLPKAGANYGWPLATHGIDYSGQPIAEAVGKEAAGTEAPHYVFEVSPGLSGMAFYTGHPGEPWNDSLFIGALTQKNLIRLTLQGDRIVGEERLLQDRDERIRDVRVGFDGNLYVLTDEDNGKLLKIEPPDA
jgi:glucose/arabinose dehydrogenase